MKLIETDKLDLTALSFDEQYAAYNGLDTLLTHELSGLLMPAPGTPEGEVYHFERALLPVAIGMTKRGIRIDLSKVEERKGELSARIAALKDLLNKVADIIWGKPLNHNSPVQMKAILYEALAIPRHFKRKGGESKVSTDYDALTSISKSYVRGRFLASIVLRLRDLEKQFNVLNTKLRNGRWHSSFNVAGTECVKGDTVLLTHTGLRTIEDIYKDSRSVSVWTGKEFVTPARKVCYERKAGFSVTTEYGYTITGSSNHPVKTDRGYVTLADLKVGDSILFQSGKLSKGDYSLPRFKLRKPKTHTTKQVKIPSRWSEALGEWYGMMLADGILCYDTSSGHYGVKLTNSNSDIAEKFLALSEEIFGLKGSFKSDVTTVSSVMLADWLRQFGFPYGEGLGMARLKQLSPIALRAPQNILRAILRGLSLDSHLIDKGLAYGTQSPVLHQQIKIILLGLGIITSSIEGGGALKLVIPNNYLGTWLYLVGSSRAGLVAKIALSLNSQTLKYAPIPTGDFYLKVARKEKWEGDVFDLTMPEEVPPEYWANGMIIHNTGRFSSSDDPFGYGANAQNIDESLRDIFIADEGKVLCYTDLKGAESMFVAYMTGDEEYMAAANSGDSHTLIASRIFKLPAEKKAVEVHYRNGKTYRDISKMAQHACVTAGHEVLTRTGWVKVEKYNPEDEICVYDKAGKLGFEKPAYWHANMYAGLTYQFYNKEYSQCVTPNHSFLWKGPDGKRKRITVDKLASLMEGSLYYFKPVFIDGEFSVTDKLTSTIKYELSDLDVDALHMICPYYEGVVYCPTVSTGYFIVRHQGKVSVCGNSNYTGTPFAIAMQSGVPVVVVEEFQKGYFKSYPGIKDWQQATIEELQTTGALITPTGAKRVFWDRLRDDSTIKKAMAFKPQGGIAHLMNMGMCRLHYGLPEAELLAQIHDAVIFQIDENRLDELLPKAVKLLEVPLQVVDIHGTARMMKVPVEVNWGRNWAKRKPLYDKTTKEFIGWKNPDGQREWKPAT